MAAKEKYDGTLLGILQNEGQISNFLETIFGFLYRRTDFYYVMKNPGEKLGFPPGISAKIAYSAYKKFEDEARESEKSAPKVPPAAVEMEVSSEPAPEVTKKTVESKQKPSATAADTKKPDIGEKSTECDKSTTTPNHATSDGGDSNEKAYVANAECYNGATRDNYSWSQTITDVDVRIKVPSHIRKGKQVNVNISRKHLKAVILDGDETDTCIDEDLSWEVHKDDCFWSLVPGEHIHINLDKVQERWWESLLANEEKINVRKIDASRPITDLDDEAQAKIEEMMYNEQQKRLGLPQSHEQNVNQILKKAWNVEGSPFKGTPYDPSKVQIGSNSTSDWG